MRYKKPYEPQRPYWSVPVDRRPDRGRDTDDGEYFLAPSGGEVHPRRRERVRLIDTSTVEPVARAEETDETISVRQPLHRRGTRRAVVALAVGAMFLVAALLKPWSFVSAASPAVATPPLQPSHGVQTADPTNAAGPHLPAVQPYDPADQPYVPGEPYISGTLQYVPGVGPSSAVANPTRPPVEIWDYTH